MRKFRVIRTHYGPLHDVPGVGWVEVVFASDLDDALELLEARLARDGLTTERVRSCDAEARSVWAIRQLPFGQVLVHLRLEAAE